MKFSPQNPLPEPEPTLTHLALYRRLATVFIVMTVAVAGLVFYVVWSRATVIVLSRQEEIRAEFIADVSGNPSGGEMAGAVVTTTETATDTFPVSSASKWETHAEGRVVITSSLPTSQTLVVATRLLTPDGILFRIKDQVVVPAGGSVEVDIFSDGIGALNDIGDATFIIPGLAANLQPMFKVRTVGPVGGGMRDTRIVTKADFEAAVADIQSRISKSVAAKLRQEAMADGASISGEVINVTVLSKTIEPEVGSVAETFRVSLEARADGVFFDRTQLDRLSEARIREILPFGKQLSALQDAATAISVDKMDIGGERANLRVSVLGTAVLSGDSPSLDPAKLAGVTEEAAIVYLEQVSGIASASIKISPFWSGRMPTVADNIRVEVR